MHGMTREKEMENLASLEEKKTIISEGKRRWRRE